MRSEFDRRLAGAIRRGRCLDGLHGVAAVGGLYGALLGGERLVRSLIAGWMVTGGVLPLLSGALALGCLAAVFFVTMRHTDLASLSVGWPASLQVAVSMFSWVRHGGPLLVSAVALAADATKNRVDDVSADAAAHL